MRFPNAAFIFLLFFTPVLLPLANKSSRFRESKIKIMEVLIMKWEIQKYYFAHRLYNYKAIYTIRKTPENSS